MTTRKLLSLALLALLAFATPSFAQVPSLQNFRNLIVGGDVGVDPFQSGTTAITGINTTGTYYGDDTYAFANNASASVTVTRENAAPDISQGYGASVRVQRLASNTSTQAIVWGQILESQNVIQLQGQTVVLSAVCQAGANFSAAGSQINLGITTGTTADQGLATRISGWAGAATLTPIVTQGNPGASALQTITTSFGRVQVVYQVPANALELAAEISYTPVGTAGTNDWVECEHWQLEAVPNAAPGSQIVATPPERRPPGVELLLAQRYVWTITDGATTRRFCNGMSPTTTSAIIVCNNPVTMRAAPTTTLSTGTSGFDVLIPAGTVQACTTLAATATANTVTSISVTCTVAANLVAGSATQLVGDAGTVVIINSARL